MTQFIINEWVWHFVSGAQGPDGQRVAVELFSKLAKSPHQIIIIEGSPFDHKAYARYTSGDAIVRRIIKLYAVEVRQNLDRCVILKQNDLDPLPDDVARSVKDDDHYLVQAQLAVQGSIVVTTDGPLRTTLSRFGLAAISPDQFMSTYFPLF